MKSEKAKKYTKKQLKIFKGLLFKTKEQLIEQIVAVEKDALKKSQKDASGDLSGYSIHMADIATDNYDREFSLNRASVDQQVIYAIEEALKRIDEGEYGICTNCGKNISQKRLKAIPYAELCIDCQGDEERQKKK